MSSAVSRAAQKWKEFWGTSITKDQQLESMKLEINDIDKFFRYATRSLTSVGSLHSQLQQHMTQFGSIISRFYLHEVSTNRELGTQLQDMFSKLAEIHGTKVDQIMKIVNEFTVWFTTVSQIKILLERYEEERLVYDHYRLKVEELRKEAEGKGGKLEDKLQRNQSKYSKSSNSFQKLTKDIIYKMNMICHNKVKMMNTGLQEFIQIEHEINKESNKYYSKQLDFASKFKLEPLEGEEEESEQDDFIIKTRLKLSQVAARQEQESPTQIKVEQQQYDTPTSQGQISQPIQQPQQQQQQQQQSQLQQSVYQPQQMYQQPKQPQPSVQQQSYSNPFDDTPTQQPQQQQQQRINPFADQVVSNPFDDSYEEPQSIPSIIMSQPPRQYQTYQQGKNTGNPFDDNDEEQQQQNQYQQQYQFHSQSKNPFD